MLDLHLKRRRVGWGAVSTHTADISPQLVKLPALSPREQGVFEGAPARDARLRLGVGD